MNKLAKERCSVAKKKKKKINTVNQYYNIERGIICIIYGCQIQLYLLSK